MLTMPDTITYFNENAKAFFSETADVDWSGMHSRFLSATPSGCLILDAGCGSGRDSTAFFSFQSQVRDHARRHWLSSKTFHGSK